MKRILGFTEEKTSCECCGKENLKGTYAIEIDGADPVYYGSTCAFKNFGFTKEDTKVADKSFTKLKSALWVSGSKTIEEHNAKIHESFQAINRFRINTMKIEALPETEMRLLTHPGF